MLRMLKLDTRRQTALSPNILLLPAVIFQFLLCLFPLTFEGICRSGNEYPGQMWLSRFGTLSQCVLISELSAFKSLLNTSSSAVCLWKVPVRQLVSWTFSNNRKSNHQDFTVKDLLSSLLVFFLWFLRESRDENRQPILSGPSGESNTSCQNSSVSRKTDYQ